MQNSLVKRIAIPYLRSAERVGCARAKINATSMAGCARRGTDMLWSEPSGAWLAAYGAFRSDGGYTMMGFLLR